MVRDCRKADNADQSTFCVPSYLIDAELPGVE